MAVEDDIDTAPVMITIRTGEKVQYTALIIATFMIVIGGTLGINKFVLKD